MNTCKTCRWWVRQGTMSAGHCHRLPPAVAASDGEIGTYFPFTDDDEFCGEWTSQKPLREFVIEHAEREVDAAAALATGEGEVRPTVGGSSSVRHA